MAYAGVGIISILPAYPGGEAGEQGMGGVALIRHGRRRAGVILGSGCAGGARGRRAAILPPASYLLPPPPAARQVCPMPDLFPRLCL